MGHAWLPAESEGTLLDGQASADEIARRLCRTLLGVLELCVRSCIRQRDRTVWDCVVLHVRIAYWRSGCLLPRRMEQILIFSLAFSACRESAASVLFTLAKEVFARRNGSLPRWRSSSLLRTMVVSLLPLTARRSTSGSRWLPFGSFHSGAKSAQRLASAAMRLDR